MDEGVNEPLHDVWWHGLAWMLPSDDANNFLLPSFLVLALVSLPSERDNRADVTRNATTGVLFFEVNVRVKFRHLLYRVNIFEHLRVGVGHVGRKIDNIIFVLDIVAEGKSVVNVIVLIVLMLGWVLPFEAHFDNSNKHSHPGATRPFPAGTCDMKTLLLSFPHKIGNVIFACWQY